MSVDALSPQDALVAVMIATSAADETMTESELRSITSIVQLLPVFTDYDADRVKAMGALVSDLFTEEDGLDALLGLVDDALPEHLRETAYALACDVAAA
ncbi:MAG: tellurite resistance TerB family protein, partial [Pseudomonadota bacterium]